MKLIIETFLLGDNMKIETLTKAFEYKTTRICVIYNHSEKKFKIMKKVINYIRGKNVESWRIMGSASVFDDIESCTKKFSKLVNDHRKTKNLSPINFEID